MDLKTLAPRVRYGVATKSELAGVPREELVAILKDGPSYRFSDGLVGKEIAGKPGERQVDHIASTESVDGQGDVIRVAGWDLNRVKTGALPVLYGHDSSSLPVGVVKTAKKENAPGSRALILRSQFNTAEDYGGDPAGTRAEAVYNLVSKGLIKGGSVGFIPKKMRWPEPEEREALGMDSMGLIFEEQELLEWSITPIPANQDAQKLRSAGRPILKAMVENGQLKADEAQKLEDELFDTTLLEALLKPEKSVHALGGIEEASADEVKEETTVVEKAAAGEPVSDLVANLKALDTVELLELSTLLVAELNERDDSSEARHTGAATLEADAPESEPELVNTLERKQDETIALLKEIRDSLKPAAPESERADERETELDSSAGTSDTAVTRESDPREFHDALLAGLSEHIKNHGV